MTATSFDPSTDNKNSVNIYIFKKRRLLYCQPYYLHCTLDLELKLHTLLDFFVRTFQREREREEGGGGGGEKQLLVVLGS